MVGKDNEEVRHRLRAIDPGELAAQSLSVAGLGVLAKGWTSRALFAQLWRPL